MPLPQPVERVYGAWLEEIEGRLADPACDRNRLCREVLGELYFGLRGAEYEERVGDPSTPLTTKAALLALDPRNVTLEAEYYHEVDPQRYAQVKPLLWLWQSFDRSPLGGGNVDIGVRLRRILARHIFERCGDRFKCFQFVEFSFGYKMEVGDGVVVHRHALLDDRGGIVLGDRTSLADYANIYSHTHSITDQEDVTNRKTVLEEGVRVTYHATVLAGVRVGAHAMVGAGAVLTKDARPWTLYLGIPAKPVLTKPNAPPEFREGQVRQ